MTTELRTHQARSDTMAHEHQTVTWIRAVVFGFHEAEYSDEGVERWLAGFVDQNARMRGIHDLDTGGVRDAALDRDVTHALRWAAANIDEHHVNRCTSSTE